MTNTPETPETSTSIYAPGDVLRLKSGGPKMTVLDMDGAGAVSVSWFDRNGKLHKDSFTLAMVERFLSNKQ